MFNFRKEGFLAEQKDSDPLTFDAARKLFFLSFRYSQGSPYMQERIFEYLHWQNPHWRISAPLKPKLQESCLMLFKKYFDIGYHEKNPDQLVSQTPLHTEIYFEDNSGSELNRDVGVRGELSKFQDTMNTKKVINPIEELTLEIIRLDHKYLITNNGRPRNTPHDISSPQTDHYLSHICYYGYAKKNTGMPEYNKMFADIIKYVNSNPHSLQLRKGDAYDEDKCEPTYIEKLRKVVDLYTSTHPGFSELFVA